MRLELLKERCIPDHAVLDDLRQSAAELALGQLAKNRHEGEKEMAKALDAVRAQGAKDPKRFLSVFDPTLVLD